MPDHSTLLRGNVPAAYGKLLVDYLQKRGLEADVSEQEMLDQSVAIQEWQQRLQEASTRLSDPLLGLHLGQTVTASHFGILGYVFLACGNLAAALERFQRYQRLVYDVNPMTVTVAGDQVHLAWGVEQGCPGPLVDETAITALIQFCRDLTGVEALAAQSIAFVNPQPADISPYENWFGCPVYFDQPNTRVTLAAHELQRSLRQPDPGLVAILESQADAQLSKLTDLNAWEQQVRTALSRQLPQATASLDSLAMELNVSPRTLHRRLAAEGWRFADLLADTRFQLAKEYLSTPGLQLAEIAQLLGYSEQSAFNRAFNGWSGCSPGRWRKDYTG